MAFKLTYTDGQEDDYDDGTEWAVEGGVLKMGREAGNWTVLVSPSHWATIEVDKDKGTAKNQAQEEDEGKDQAQDKDKEGQRRRSRQLTSHALRRHTAGDTAIYLRVRATQRI